MFAHLQNCIRYICECLAVLLLKKKHTCRWDSFGRFLAETKETYRKKTTLRSYKLVSFHIYISQTLKNHLKQQSHCINNNHVIVTFVSLFSCQESPTSKLSPRQSNYTYYNLNRAHYTRAHTAENRFGYTHDGKMVTSILGPLSAWSNDNDDDYYVGFRAVGTI